MSRRTAESPISTVLVDECFANGDDQFVDQMRIVTSPKYLVALADRWKKDPRPWAREQILRYLELPFDCPGHHPVVKRLFKHAESTHDDQLMAAFLPAFDRLVRRERRTRYRYDYRTRQSWQEEVLVAPRDQILPSANQREFRNPRTGQKISVPNRNRVPENGRLFSYRTRRYLQRRVARYFRRLGFQRPQNYVRLVSTGLALYRNDDVAAGENILDNWSLMQIAFRRSDVLKFMRTTVGVADGRSLGELSAAPQFPKLWNSSDSAAILLNLLAVAQSRLVRVFAIQLLKRDHLASLQSVSVEQLLALLNHADDEVQHFGAGLLETLPGVDSWPVTTWLRLLETRSVTALATICDVMNKRVRSDRLDLEQCVALTCVRPTPVARLGLTWLKEKPLTRAQDRAILRRLASVQCDAVGVDAAEVALSVLGAKQDYRTDDVCPFFDSLNANVRRGAWQWLIVDSAGYSDPLLWSRLLESPYDDVKMKLIDELNQRTHGSNPVRALQRQDVSSLWTSVLLGVHRGGRAKLKALRQISDAIAKDPGRADQLIPVLTVAIRSVRPPEVRAGLSAILTAVAIRPELEEMLSRQLPELRLSPAKETL